MNKRNIQSKKGITLIALVVTIIVLIILAGISINLMLGENGILTKSKDTRATTKLSQIEEYANMLLINKHSKKSDEEILEEIVDKLNTPEYGYQIEFLSASGSNVTGINVSSKMQMGKNSSKNLIVTFEGGTVDPSEGDYYALVDGKYYKVALENGKIEVSKEPREGGGSGATLTASSSNNSLVSVGTVSGTSIPLTGGSNTGKATITVTYGEFSKTCEVSVITKPTTSSSVANTSFSTNYGRIDVIWLKDDTNEVISSPNAPVLKQTGQPDTEKMTPIKWTTVNSVLTPTPTTEADEDWYNYIPGSGNDDNTSKGNNLSNWANARTKNESYFVWIPRYAYRITYYDSKTSTAPTGYYDGLGMWNAQDGKLKYKLETGVNTVPYNGELYIVHPAFDNTLDMGGWSDKISGFWFAKYEMSGSTAANLKSTFEVQSQGNQKLGVQYVNARQAKYGYSGTVDSFDNKRSFMHSHLVKNSEWGAVAYLTHSQYGRNGAEIDFNNTTSTGYGAGSPNSNQDRYAYNTEKGQGASTTGNVYGIYDMSGGKEENTAIFNNKDDRRIVWKFKLCFIMARKYWINNKFK